MNEGEGEKTRGAWHQAWVERVKALAQQARDLKWEVDPGCGANTAPGSVDPDYAANAAPETMGERSMFTLWTFCRHNPENEEEAQKISVRISNRFPGAARKNTHDIWFGASREETNEKEFRELRRKITAPRGVDPPYEPTGG